MKIGYPLKQTALLLPKMEIAAVIDSHGSKYLHPEIVISGTGGSDPILVINEEGIITEIIYNDPRIKNIELDKVDTH